MNTNYPTLCLLFKIVIALYVTKSLYIGSSFNFWKWAQYGKYYIRWYDDKDRNTFKYIPPQNRKIGQ